MKSHDRAGQLALQFASRNLNEADTRHQLIDPLLHDVLAWPKNRVRCEEYIQPGYADYVLLRHDETRLLFIETKREGDYFALPHALVAPSKSVYIKVKTLLTDDRIAAAIN